MIYWKPFVAFHTAKEFHYFDVDAEFGKHL